MGGLLWQLLRQLLAARERLSSHVRSGASVPYVRATRTGLPRTVRTRGTGRLAPGPHALYVQGHACQPRSYRACRVPWHPPTHNREPYDTLLSDTMAIDPSVEPMPLSSTRLYRGTPGKGKGKGKPLRLAAWLERAAAD